MLFAVATWWRTRSGFDVVHSHENTWHGQIQTVHVRPLRFNLFHGRTGLGLLLRWCKVVLSLRLITYVWLEGARFKHSASRRVVATSQSLRTECEQAYPDSAVSVITPGTHSPGESLSRQVARQRLGLPQQGQLVLFVANDYARKGLDALLQAMTRLPAEVGLVVVGNSKPILRYRQMAAQLGLQGRVHFIGSLNDLSPAYWAADCLAHPTLEDTFAMVVLEAMAHGLPVVVSGAAYCGISSQLVHATHALLLRDPKDPQTLAESIHGVLTHAELAKALQANGQKFALTHSWEEAALQYEKLYFQVA